MRKSKLILLIVIAMALITTMFILKRNFPMDELYILPNNFTGIVTIVYKQKSGKSTRVEEGKRVYRIPLNGVLFINDSPQDGLIDMKFRYKDSKINDFIPYCVDVEKLKKDDSLIYVYGGTRNVFLVNEEKVICTQFIVSQLNEVDSLSKYINEMSPIEFLESRE